VTHHEHMRRTPRLTGYAFASCVIGVAVLSACGSKRTLVARPPSAAPGVLHSTPVTERLVTRSARLTVEVADVLVRAKEVEDIVRDAGGFVADQTQTDESRLSYTLQVPAAKLDDVLDRLAGLGRTTERSVSARDVTDEAADLDARLRNKRALRERLREHLGSTSTLQEVLALEEQLARVQAEIDVLEGQISRIQSSVALSRVAFTLERRRQLGPLGYVFEGLFWVLKKLFVWR